MLRAYEIDNEFRHAHHGDKWFPGGMQADIRQIEPGVVFDKGDLKITMFEVDHTPAIPAMGYRFDFRGKPLCSRVTPKWCLK